ncbi:MAG: hypothetical protein H7070_02980 [Saprospiraceae bacterium]|nr:hypothetical protein [Pyrinomonadaceae bacterium]
MKKFSVTGTKPRFAVSKLAVETGGIHMNERFKLSLSGMWLLVSLFALILPIFLPSTVDTPSLAANSIGTATTTMFILSFPSSLFGIPLLFMADYVLNVQPNSMQGMYVNLTLLFVLGIVQWFWIVPRVWKNEPEIQLLTFSVGGSRVLLPESKASDDFEFFASRDKTPLERVLNDND